MNFHVTFSADDLLSLEYTGNTSTTIGRQYTSAAVSDAPSFYAKPGDLRRLAEQFDRFAQEAGE